MMMYLSVTKTIAPLDSACCLVVLGCCACRHSMEVEVVVDAWGFPVLSEKDTH